MDDIYRNLSTLDYWGHGYGTEVTFDVTELWHNTVTGKVSTKTRKIDPINVHSWVTEETSGTEDQAQTLIVRWVWIDVDVKDKIIKQSEATTRFLVNSFGLTLAYAYARSCLSGATVFPPQSHGESAQLRPYSFCYTPKIAAVWSQRRPNAGTQGHQLTQGIYFVQDTEKKSLQMALQGHWVLDVYRNPVFPALPIALVLGAQIDGTTAAIKNDLRSVEARTGYHNFASRNETPAKEELGELSARTSGSAAKLASTLRKSKTLERLLSFMTKALGDTSAATTSLQESSRALGSSTSTDDMLGHAVLKHHVSVLQERQEMQLMDTEYTLKRLHVQIDALFSIIQQQDAIHNIELSKSTHEIAYFSYRDSSSMKTLAVVTMFFLPGSFISALFSTNCFEWASVDLASKDIGVRTTPQFSLYWAITIPLTLITFLLYFLWLGFQKYKRDAMFDHGGEGEPRRMHHLRALALQNMEEAEGQVLARRRETLMEKIRTTNGLAEMSW